MSNKAVIFLKQCNEKAHQENNKYCSITVSELKKNLSGERPLFYLGSDSSYHYFVYAYDKIVKISGRLKLAKNEFIPKNEFLFKEENEQKYNFPVYLSDL